MSRFSWGLLRDGKKVKSRKTSKAIQKTNFLHVSLHLQRKIWNQKLKFVKIQQSVLHFFQGTRHVTAKKKNFISVESSEFELFFQLNFLCVFYLISLLGQPCFYWKIFFQKPDCEKWSNLKKIKILRPH